MPDCQTCHAPTPPGGACLTCGPDATAADFEPGGERFEPRAGARVGEYRLCERLDHGAMGEVWRGEHATLHGTGPHRLSVAVKLMLPEVAARPALRDRFAREARAHARIDHPSIPRFYAYGEVSGRPYLVMALIEGPTLKAHLAGRALPVAEARAIGAQLAACLDHLHRRQIVHRDLKPANIKLAGLDPLRVVVLDLGICKALGDWDDSLGTRAMLGTPAYLPPEMLGDAGRVEASADQFSLGVMLYEMLTGERPFAGPNVAATLARIHSHAPPPPSAVRGDGAIDRGLDALVMRLLDKVPGRRFGDMAAVAAALSPPMPGAPSTSSVTATMPGGRPPWWQIVRLGTGVLVAALGLAAYTCDGRRSARVDPEPLAAGGSLPTHPVAPAAERPMVTEPAAATPAAGQLAAAQPAPAIPEAPAPTTPRAAPGGEPDPLAARAADSPPASPTSRGRASRSTSRSAPRRRPARTEPVSARLAAEPVDAPGEPTPGERVEPPARPPEPSRSVEPAAPTAGPSPSQMEDIADALRDQRGI